MNKKAVQLNDFRLFLCLIDKMNVNQLGKCITERFNSRITSANLYTSIKKYSNLGLVNITKENIIFIELTPKGNEFRNACIQIDNILFKK